MAIGPVLISMPRLFLALGIMAALMVAHVVERRTGSNIERPLWLALLVGLLGARMGYVLPRFDQFADRFWEVLYLWQGGFAPMVGVLAAAATAAWIAWRRGVRYGSMGAPLLAGLIVWGSLALTSHALERGTRNPLPDVAVRDLGGNEKSLADYRGQPVVVNLWASWCPPCRREMPMLEAAQARNGNIHFIFLNQGESKKTVERYLAQESLDLGNVLLDEPQAAGRRLRAPGLPTTFFFNADGERVDRHVGELTRPRLGDYLRALDGS